MSERTIVFCLKGLCTYLLSRVRRMCTKHAVHVRETFATIIFTRARYPVFRYSPRRESRRQNNTRDERTKLICSAIARR